MDDSTGENGQNKDKTSRNSVHFWKSQLRAAKEVASSYWTASDDAWAEYMGSYAQDSTLRSSKKTQPARFPLYWSSVRTIQPALYSRTPTVIAQPMLDTLPDDVVSLGCGGLERLAKYLIRRFNFDRTIYQVRDDMIHTGKAAPRVHYEATTKTEIRKKRIFPKFSEPMPPEPGAVPPDQSVPGGGPLPGMPPAPPPPPAAPEIPQIIGFVDNLGADVQFDGEPLQDEEGLYLEEIEESLEDECLELLPVPYRDCLHTPYARFEEEIDWKAYASSLTRREVVQRFGAGAAKDLRYSEKRDNEDTKAKKPKKDTALPDKVIRIWEIWDKERRVVRFLPEHSDKFIVPKDAETVKGDKGAIKDPYGLPGFFPSPDFMIGTYGPDNMYPTPDYVQLKPFIDQLHGLSDRFRRLVRSSKVRGVYDASIKELADLSGATPMDGDYIGINNYQGQIVGKGGLDQVIQQFPTEKIVEAVQIMSTIMDQYQQRFEYIWGIPDILTGNTNPQETAAAQQEKGKYLSLRFSAIQREFQRLIRDSLEKLVDLALVKFDDEKLQQIMGFSLWEQEQKEMWPQMIDLLRDFKNRAFRIDIETDSTISFNEEAEVSQRMKLLETVGNSLLQIQQAANGDTDIQMMGYTIMQYVTGGMRSGKVMADSMKKLIEKVANPPPPPPPPPDPAQIRADADKEIAQVKAQTDMSVAQMKAQSDLSIAQIKAQADAQVEQMRGQIEQIKVEAQGRVDAQAMQSDAMVKILHSRIAETQAARDSEAKRQQAEFDAQMRVIELKFEQQIDSIKASAELEKARLENQWQLAESQSQILQKQLDMVHSTRESEAKIQAERSTAEAASRPAPEPKMPNIHVHLGGKKRITGARNTDGTSSYEVEDLGGEEE